VGTQPARRTGWLYQLPPWRAPRLRRHHHHHTGIVEAFALMMGLFLYALFFFEIWMLEALLWAAIWGAIGATAAGRWMWRRNPIGRTIDQAHDAKLRRLPRRYDPDGTAPTLIDLGAFDGRERPRT